MSLSRSLPSSAVNRMFCSACNGPCDKTCPSSIIDSVDAAQGLKGCTVIDGNLDINIRHGSEWLDAKRPAAMQITPFLCHFSVIFNETCVLRSKVCRVMNRFFVFGLAFFPLTDIFPVSLYLIIIEKKSSFPFSPDDVHWGRINEYYMCF